MAPWRDHGAPVRDHGALEGPWRPCQGPGRPTGTMAPWVGPGSTFKARIRSQKSQNAKKIKSQRSVNSPRLVARRRSRPGAGSQSSWDAPVVVKA
ncbi:hypothetical protein SUGI_0949730 [Cryptomeria japonica]|nr:hypothetical protein SUGI_0949730 [Cryptomeria japonica]